MPYKCEKIKLSPEQDRRRKLSDEQKETIKKEYGTGLISQRALGRKYNVSRSTIAVIVSPERAEKVKQRVKDHWKDYVPSREEHNAIMRKHRHYKQRLYLEGKLKEDNSNADKM